MGTDRTVLRRGGRVREWLVRYGPAEVAALLGAIVAASIAYRLGGPAAAALAGSIGEGIAFYAVIAVRDLRGRRRAGTRARGTQQTARDVLLEFGLAELVDTFAVRPLAMYAGPALVGNMTVGVILGKIAADVVFYTLAIIGYELRKAAATRRPADAASVAGRRPAGPLPADRPADPLAPAPLDQLPGRTPYLLMDLDRVERAS